MDTTFLEISKSLIESEFDTKYLEIFKINNLDGISAHMLAFIGCEPFRKEIKFISSDIVKYNEFTLKTE